MLEKSLCYWAVCQTLLGETLLAGPLERENCISFKMSAHRKQVLELTQGQNALCLIESSL